CRVHEPGNIHIAGQRANAPGREQTFSFTMVSPFKHDACLGLEHRDEMAGHYVHLVLMALLLRQVAFITFLGQLSNSRLHLAVRFYIDKLARRFVVERRANGLNDTIENWLSLEHARSIPRQTENCEFGWILGAN